MKKYNNKSFLYHLQKPFKLDIKKDLPNNPIEDYTWTIRREIQTSYINQFDEILLDMIFDEFKKSDATDLIVLDRAEFRKFLMKYLPIYIQEKDNE